MAIKRIHLVSFLVWVQAVTSVCAQELDDASLTAHRSDGAVKLGLQHAAAYDIYRDEQRDTKLELHPAALFKFTNPVPQESSGRAQELYGAVFLSSHPQPFSPRKAARRSSG